MMKNFKAWLSFLLLSIGLIGTVFTGLSCSVSSDGFYFGALGLNEGRVFVVNEVTTPAAYTITMYDYDGNFLGVVLDATSSTKIVRGIAAYSPSQLIVSTDTPDELQLLDIFTGQWTSYVQSAFLSGNIYDVVHAGSGKYFVAESNKIERFDNGQRFPIAGPEYIPVSVGACGIFSMYGLTMTSAGHLAGVDTLNDSVLIYNVAGATPICLSAVAMGNPDSPVDAIGHSDGNIYVAANGTNTIYKIPSTYIGYTTVVTSVLIDTPVAISALPGGDLLVAADGTVDAIMRVTTSGTVVGTFVKNAFTGRVRDIYVMPPQ